jgi:hypothetical protein
MGIDLYLIFALATTSILGLVKILSIVPFNRLAADDFSFTVSLLGHNVFSFVYGWYMTLTARYTSNILIGSFGILSGPGANPYIFTLLTVILGFLSLAYFISSLTKSKFLGWKNVLVAAVLLVSYFVLTPSVRESWYWLNSAATYLWPTFFDLIIIALLIRSYKSWWVYLPLFILTFLAGGGNECILVINFLVAGIALACIVLKELKIFSFKNILGKIIKCIKFPNRALKQMLMVFLGAAISLVIIYLAPGNNARLDSPTSNPMSIFGSLFYSFRDGPLLVWNIFKNNVLFIIPLFVSLTYFFTKLIPKANKKDKVDGKNIPSLILFTLSALIFLSVIFTMIGYMSLGRVLEPRAFVTVTFFVLVAFILAAYFTSLLIPSFGKNAQKWIMGLILASSFLVFVSGLRIVSTLAEDIYTARNYAQAYDATFKMLRETPPLKEHKIIYIKQLPPSGQVKFWQVTASSEAWENQVVPVFLKINATLVAN